MVYHLQVHPITMLAFAPKHFLKYLTLHLDDSLSYYISQLPQHLTTKPPHKDSYTHIELTLGSLHCRRHHIALEKGCDYLRPAEALDHRFYLLVHPRTTRPSPLESSHWDLTDSAFFFLQYRQKNHPFQQWSHLS